MSNNVFNQYKQYQNYALIAIISIISIVFFPFVGSNASATCVFPTTAVGWIIYLFTKLAVVGINMSLFYCFMEQAKANVKDNPRYIEANEILQRYNIIQTIFLGPDEWTRKQYLVKGTTVSITTALSTFALTQAILTFDWMAMITYLITIIFGTLFGVIQMNVAENYWTNDFYYYAKKIEQERNLQQGETNNDNLQQ